MPCFLTHLIDSKFIVNPTFHLTVKKLHAKKKLNAKRLGAMRNANCMHVQHTAAHTIDVHTGISRCGYSLLLQSHIFIIIFFFKQSSKNGQSVP